MTKFLSDDWMERYGFDPKPDEPQYKPSADLAQLAQDSEELANLSCADTWVQQHRDESSA